MACRLAGAKPLSEPMLEYNLRNKVQWNLKQNSYILIEENAFENVVCEITSILSRPQYVNSLWPSDAIWWHRSGSTLAQVRAWWSQMASHFLSQQTIAWANVDLVLNQCWLIISKVHWPSCEGNFTRDIPATNHYNLLEDYLHKVSFKFPWGTIKVISTRASFNFHSISFPHQTWQKESKVSHFSDHFQVKKSHKFVIKTLNEVVLLKIWSHYMYIYMYIYFFHCFLLFHYQ